MNKLRLIVLLLLITFTVKAQPRPSDKGIVMLTDFYTAYISAAADHESDLNVSEAKMDALKHRYCTTACQKRIKVLIDETDADPIIQAQDCDKTILNTIIVKKDNQKPNRYVVTYIDKSNHNKKTTIYLTLKIEKNMLKIGYIE
ncbi:hypothetical protein [Pedobacter sp. UYP1]|uniref:hypothetical protein n=1 Tax=Pedobacter sp. UYP1 TaxID=1756396 RepID=UPI0033939B4D